MPRDPRIPKLAKLLGLTEAKFKKYLKQLRPPLKKIPAGLQLPPKYQEILEISNGIKMISKDNFNSFHLWGVPEILEAEMMAITFKDFGVIPIYGQIPHLVSIRLKDQAIVHTDWEVMGSKKDGWLKVVAPDLKTYVKRVIAAADKFGTDWEVDDVVWNNYAEGLVTRL